MKTIKIVASVRENSEEPVYVQASGIVDPSTAFILRFALLEFIQWNTCHLVAGVPFVLDLTEVSYIDCAGLGAIISGVNRLKKLNPSQTIFIVGTEGILKVFALSGVGSALRLCRSIREVVQKTEDDFDALYQKNPCPQAI